MSDVKAGVRSLEPAGIRSSLEPIFVDCEVGAHQKCVSEPTEKPGLEPGARKTGRFHIPVFNVTLNHLRRIISKYLKL